MKTHRASHPRRKPIALYVAVILAMVLSLTPQIIPGVEVPTAEAHNLQTKMVYMFFDPDTQADLDARIASPSWTPPTPLLQVGDELGIIIKVVPRDGTNTGVGGHVDFYVPNGTTVIDAAYLLPGDANPGDGISGYDKVPMKGQSLIAVGDGPIGAKTTTQLIGLGTVGPNVLGFSTNPVVPATGLHRGTIAGVYGDTGIFYATDPDTSYGSWQRFTGDPDQICGLAGLPGVTGKTITNNSGDVFVPCNKWDAGQMYAWGVKGTTWTGSGAATAPIVDYGDGRGNSPWGFASGVAGPQSGYGWNFNWNEWRSSAKTAQDMRNAMGNDEIGPWKRIRYTGSRISSDQPGTVSTVLGIASVDGGSVGYALSPSNPLPDTTSQSDTTSPKAIRWAVGQLTNLVPEFVWVKIKVNSVAAIVNADGCPIFNGDTFGGDAGGSDNGKDHLWRYYEPSRATWNGCLALGKPATRDLVKVGDVYQYKVKIYNAGTINDFTNVVVKDTLPSGVQFISAFPAQASGPNPLVWNVPSLRRGEMFEALVTVKATGTGVLENTLCVDAAGTNFDQCVEEDTTSGPYPMLRQGKTASPTTVAPGNPTQYTIQIDNIGSGPTGSPITVRDYLPTGFTFASKDLVTINGANVTATTTVNTGTPGEVLFTIPGTLNAGQSLIVKYTTTVPLGTPAGTYCNSYTTTQNGTPLSTGSLACITVGSGAIGDTLFRDWNGNGVQDPEDEGIAGVTVELQNGTCTPGSTCPTTTTDADGNYVFEGLAAGTYTVKVTDLGEDGTPLTGDEVLTGYTQTFDPNGTCLPTPGVGCDGQSTVTLITGQRNMDQDFGYKPGGAGSIGDTLWEDDGSGGGTAGNGAQEVGEPGIANVTVYLYEDTNGNGAIDPDDALVATDVTDASGIYGFTGLAVNLNYLVKIDEADPDFTGAFGPGAISSSTGRLQGVQPTTDTPNITTVDFGYYQPPPASVGDTVCIDTDGDRLCTGADTPLPNVEVAIYQDLNRNGIVDPGEPLVGTDVTDANGVYGFSGLAAGAYVVEVNTADPDLPGGLASTLNPQGVFLLPGDNNLAIDFPFVQRLTKAVRNVTTNQNPGTNASPGDVLEYKITPNYTGSNLLSSLKVTDTVPTGTTFVSALPAQTSGPDPLVWNLGSNTPGVPGVGVLCPVTVELDAEKDTHITQNDGDENKNYGASDTLETANDGTSDIAGLLRFDLSSIPPGVTLDTATLKLTVENGAGSNRQIEIHELLTGFTEGTGASGGTVCTSAANGASWGDTDGADAGRGGPNCTDSWTPVDSFTSSNYGVTNYGTIDPLTDEATYSVDVKTLVQSWLTTPSSNIGFAMIPAGSATNAVSWHSSESVTATKRPKLAIKYLVSQTGACAINTDAMAVFSVNATASKYSAFNGSTNVWGAATNMAAFANKQRFLTLASGTTRNESIATAVLDNNTTAGQFWNGTTWSALPNPPAGASGQLGTVSTDLFYSTDVAYESDSGDALVVWDDNVQTGSAKLRFATYDGTTWSAAASVGAAYTGGEPLFMHLDTAPGSDSMVMVVNDLTFDDYALVWDGSAWGNGLSLDTSGIAVDDRTSLYTAYERTSGDAMVVYAKHNDAKVYYRIWNGVSWSVEASLSAPSGVSSQPQWLVLASDPSSDRLVLGVLTTAKVVWLSVWDGSAWGATTTATTGAQTAASPVVSVAFETLTGRALAVYGEGKNVRYRTWSSVGNTWTAELNGPVLANNTATLLLDADPNSNEIMLTSLDSGKKVAANLWNGSAWGALTTLSAGSNYSVGQPFDFHWQQNVLTQADTKAALTVNRSLVTDTGAGESVLVTLTAVSSTAGTVTANALTVSGVNGASATCSAASPAGPQAIGANGQVQFTYTCTVTAGAAPGSVTFSTTPTGAGGTGGFVQATSASVLATPPLTYQVTVDNPATVAEVKNTAQLGDDSGTIPPTNSNETHTLLPAGSIGDFVWYDTNGNGLPDETNCSGSPCGAPNATLVLVQDLNGNGVADIGEPVIATYVTDSTGAYLFDDLPPGNYVVEVSEQEIPSPTSGNIGRMVGTTGTSKAVTLGLGQDITTVDFGFIEAASVEGTLFHDVNHNGVLDPGEPVLPNVTVTLTGTDSGGNPVTLTTTTDANGEYLFVTPPGNYTITYDTVDPDIPAGLTEPTTPVSISLTVNAGVEYTGLDFGIDNPGRIGDRVWNDANGDGIQTAGEPGLAGVTVYLCGSTPCDSSNAIATTATDIAGFYQFVGLPDGTYYVGVDQNTTPAGYTQTGYGDPGAPCGGCNGQSPAVLIAGGNTDPTVDFGYKAPVNDPLNPYYSVSGRVWDDLDGDGTQDVGELGIPGVTVCLYDSTGVTALACTVTLSNGDYSFPGVAPGTYVIKVDTTTLPSTAYFQTGDPDQVGTCTTCDNKTTITVAGANVTNKNFGYDQLPGSISGTVCEGDGDGLCEPPGETGLTPVTVTLIYAGQDGILGTGDDVSTPTITDANGDYSFAGLAPGLYQIVETDPPGYISLADADGGNPNNISLALALGENAVDQDFEDMNVTSGYIGNLVWWDIDEDGIQDPGEPGIPGVDVELYRWNGTAWVLEDTTTTDSAGFYEFELLSDGSYEVRIPAAEFAASGTLENWIASPQDQGMDDTVDSDGDEITHVAPVTLAGGAGTADVDFGFSIESSYTVTKTLNSPSPTRPGEPINFTIRIDNTGDTWITLLPLQDTYNNTYLTYGFGGDFATPDSDNHVNDGVIDWTDLTAAAPGGFGMDLGPGSFFDVVVWFTAREDTSALPNDEVVNTGIVSGALADPDGPGPLPLVELPPQQGSDGVIIYRPTGLGMAGFNAALDKGSVLVTWATASELDMVGFNVLRRALAAGIPTEAVEWTTINDDLILAVWAGVDAGASYRFMDPDTKAGQIYQYSLEIVHMDGRIERYGLSEVTVP